MYKSKQFHAWPRSAGSGMLLVVLTFCAPGIVCAQSIAPLGLPRLREPASVGEATPVARGKYAEEKLDASTGAGTRNGENRGAKFLALDTAREWSRPLRGGAKDLLFVSFSTYGSVGTIIEAGGAKVGIVESEVANYAQLVVEQLVNGQPQWRELGLHVPLGRFDGQLLASFPVLTIRLDRADGSWDLYHGTMLVAEDLTLGASASPRQFLVKAGVAGATINGLVQSDENPLYEDANGNGVDDVFEKQQQGRLLVASDGKSARKELIAEWHKDQRTNRPAALFVNLPRPDGQ